MASNPPEQPKFVQLDPKWKPRGHHVTTTITWESLVEALHATGKLKEYENVSAIYAYSHGIVLDLRGRR